MKILLVSATQLEIQDYILSAPHHDILITGVGLPHAIYELTNQLHGHHYDLVIQAGVGGAFEKSGLKLGDVVAVKQDAFGDAGSYEKGQFHTIQSLGLSLNKEVLENNSEVLSKIDLAQVKAITINTVTDSEAFVNALVTKWNAEVESMEGAALHFVCAKKGVPFIQIRSISNFVGERDKTKWLLATAVANLNSYLSTFIASLS